MKHLCESSHVEKLDYGLTQIRHIVHRIDPISEHGERSETRIMRVAFVLRKLISKLILGLIIRNPC